MAIAAVRVQVPLRVPLQRTNRRKTCGSSFGLFIPIPKTNYTNRDMKRLVCIALLCFFGLQYAIADNSSMAQLLKQDIDSILPTVTAVGFAATQSTVESTDFDSLAINYIDQAGKLSQQGETAASLLVTNHIIDFIYTHDTRCDSATLAKALYTCGMNYCDLGSTDQALLMYQRSLRLAQRCNDRPLMAELYNSIFSIYYQRRDFANNIDLLQSALEITLKTTTRQKSETITTTLDLCITNLATTAKLSITCTPQCDTPIPTTI